MKNIFFLSLKQKPEGLAFQKLPNKLIAVQI